MTTRSTVLFLVTALAATAAFAQDAPKADNTKINQRDRHSGQTTAFDQPNDAEDIKVAAAVRKAIVGDDSLSLSAHNVKFIASDGTVILRGPVKDEAEKARVESIVKGVPGVANVQNQLDSKH
ncbi:BON domain-containing protein [Luteibacter rhizovicinus]|uniref:BON domain-containing protein n=1 Tax=Luteibacter sp. dw_328 TaxID=2719796 RepID=UPI000A93EF7C|nr:BON domain-containing protein [Luteibacter rhizovicinus]